MGRRMMQRRVVVFLILIAAAALVEAAAHLGSTRALLNVKIYFPVIRRFYPPYPDTPWLHPIDNTDGDGNYTVRWKAAARAESYELEERWQDGDWFLTYQGSATETPLANRPQGAYLYRCRARNSWGYGAWSDWQSTTVRGTAPGNYPTPGSRSVSAGGKSVVQVTNNCPYRLHLEFTGPQPTLMHLPKCDVCRVYYVIGPFSCPDLNQPFEQTQLDPGTYRVFVTVDDPSVRPYVGHWQLQGDRRYPVCFSVVRSLGRGDGGLRAQIVVGSCD